MADDCRISTALPNHPKMKKLRRRLGDSGCLALIYLFLWTASNRCDGDLGEMTDEDIELAADWQGEAGALVAALEAVGFLDGEPGHYLIHDWPEHNPWAAGRGERIAAAKAAATVRWSKMRGASGAHADDVRGACAADESAMPPTQSQPNPTQPDPLLSDDSSDAKKGIPVGLSSEQQLRHKPSAEAHNLAQLLELQIHSNKPDAKITQAQLRNWAVTADRMIRLDHRDHDRIAELIRWAQADEFWRTNILSMEKLREKFDQLELKKSQMEAPTSKRTAFSQMVDSL